MTKYVWQKINAGIQDTVNYITLDELATKSRELLEEHGDKPRGVSGCDEK